MNQLALGELKGLGARPAWSESDCEPVTRWVWA